MLKTGIPEIRKELEFLEKEELKLLCLKLAKFKVDNKELLAYLLFDASDEQAFIESVKLQIEAQFDEINRTHYYYVKKSVRKILRFAKKYIKFSKQKETEIQILMHFLHCLTNLNPDYARNSVLKGIFQRELLHVKKTISSLHQDLQMDYHQELEELGLS